MLISDYSSEILTLGYTQLAVSIALSRLGEDKASRAVAAFYGLGLSTLFQTNFFRLFSRYCTGV